MNRKLLWLLPAVPAALLAVAILLLPSFVASSAHRRNIEALASSLTGRAVRITGRLSLGLFPAPEITASGVTISGPDAQVITARSLALDISLPALLHGQLRAQNLTLDAPTVALPWPLPGGAADIAPPSWLATLHAQIHDGTISIGAAHFSGIDADLVTGAGGTLAISGTGKLLAQPLSLTLTLGAPLLTGTTPVTLDAASGENSLHFGGGLNADGTLSGQLGLASPQLSGTASLNANGAALSANVLQLRTGGATITGTAALDFAPLALTADLNAADLDAGGLKSHFSSWPSLPIHLTLTATNLHFSRDEIIPALQTRLNTGPGGITVRALTATLPGSASLAAHGEISAAGAIIGEASLDAPDLPGLLTPYGFTPPAGWNSAHLAATIDGTPEQLSLQHLAGMLGASPLTGTLILSGHHAQGALHFERLDLPPLLAWFAHPTAQKFTADGQITADKATLGPLPLTHLLLDGSLTDHLNIRRLSANVFNGLASGSLDLNAKGEVTAARGFLALPSATPLAALLPPRWQPPAALAASRLNLSAFAQGPATALSTNLTASLDDFTLDASPVINLTQQSATGPLTLHAPNAIAALKIFGLSHAAMPPPCALPAGFALQSTPCAPAPGPAPDWPGPGSLSLRASFVASPTQFGLPDFILSLGALTANGRILAANSTLSGQIDAGTLDLPPIQISQPLPWNSLTTAQGKIALTANRVLYNGAEILTGAEGSFTLARNSATLAISHAGFAGGNVSGTITAALGGVPALTANFSGDRIQAAAIGLPVTFPYTLQSGTLTANASLTASGYTPKTWAATLAGSASLTAANGTINGFSLTGLQSALKSHARTQALRSALASGSTDFQNLTLTATAGNGNASLTHANLSGPDGSADATGSLDIFDHTLALHLDLQPDVAPPLSIGTMVLGNWAAPKQYSRLKPALDWAPQN